MSHLTIEWEKNHILIANSCIRFVDEEIEIEDLRKVIEPWLSAIFQSEHLSLLVGAGLTSAVTAKAGLKAQGMGRLKLENEYAQKILKRADDTALKMDRGEANIEDDIRAALELLTGLEILDDQNYQILKEELNKALREFIKNVLKTEKDYYHELQNNETTEERPYVIESFNLLKSFIISFTSRAASRERLNIFTTNYDRFLELACDEAGVLLLDRFKGKMQPIFRNTRLELDYHYNPPGIRGEPRYVEGVARITKLHGSLDWQILNHRIIRAPIPFGANNDHPQVPKNVIESVLIYPNASKDIETAMYPYAELFRDFATAICQPNSVIVTYGYGFGDSHINRVIEDMLTIPSAHLVIIAWDIKNEKPNQSLPFGAGRERIKKFVENKNSAQITLMLGSHFGDLETLVENYLPKSAIDRLTVKMQKIKESRGSESKGPNQQSNQPETVEF